MAILGGSPLGLVGVKSRFEKTGFSSFPIDGNDIAVPRYNSSGDSYKSFKVEISQNKKDDGKRTASVGAGKIQSSVSIFSRRDVPTRFTPYPSMPREGGNENSPDVVENGLQTSRLHGDNLYDTSISNILLQLKGTGAELKAAHFAYLKNVGVFPNNRLMIARRFASAGNSMPNIRRNAIYPLAVMISWVPQDTDFFQITFGEEWEEAEVDFTAVLNDLGNDFTKASGLGDKMGGGLGIIPLPGFTEFIQRKVLEKLGIMSEGSSSYIPAGEPNLIKQAKKRKTIGYSTAGSGLKCSFQVKMTCEWEQKFISGLDPTVVFLDIIQQCLRFSTSNSVTYGLSGGFEAKIRQYVNNPMQMIYDLMAAIQEGISSLKAAITSAINTFKSKLGPKEEKPADQQASEEKEAIEKQKKDIDDMAKSLFESLGKGVSTLLKRVVGKYKTRIEGILHALVGSPSGPWHITIGNPMRPLFSSGDLIISDVMTLSFGSTLAFNDLPSTIKAEFTLVPARNLGLQEIFARFNSGHVRSVLPFPTEGEKETLLKALGTLDSVKAENIKKLPDNPSQTDIAKQEEQVTAATAEAKTESDKAITKYILNGGSDGPPGQGLNPNLGPQQLYPYREPTIPVVNQTTPTSNNNSSNANISNTNDSSGTSGASGNSGTSGTSGTSTNGTSGTSGNGVVNGDGKDLFTGPDQKDKVVKKDANSDQIYQK